MCEPPVIQASNFSFTIRGTHTSEHTTLDVIQVAESAKVLENFLHLIYPVDSPVVEDLRLVDDLLQLADKYKAKGVTTKLKKLLVSPSFLRDDPIRVFAIACRCNFDEEAKLVVPHTFSIDLIHGISEEHLRTMTTEAYHHLLAEHALRREQLIDAVNGAQLSQLCSCRCADKLKKEVRLEISGRPFLDRDILDKCLSSVNDQNPRCEGVMGPRCILTPGQGYGLLSDIMRRI